ncbi:MAG: GDP-mannose 4,6-dehydratase [Planctomycetota bacterium]|jgi:UDP-glucuronate 4-epimerase
MNQSIDGPVLITGVAGFIGSRLARSLLAAGVPVAGVDDFDGFYDRSLKQRNLEAVRAAGAADGVTLDVLEADVRDQAAIRSLMERHRPRLVVHAAALAGVRPSIADPARYASVNVDGLVSVLEAARATDCRAILFASSSSVYGNNPVVPFAEHHEVAEPISPYAASKRAAELFCHTYSHLFGLAIATLRFFTVYGPAQRPDLAIASFMRRIAAGEPVTMFGDGTSSRDYTFVDDIVAGVLAAGHRVQAEAAAGRRFCRTYNLGGSSPITLAEMIEAIAETVGRPATIRREPMQPGDVERTWADLTRSREELGFEPRTDFRAGLAAQWRWMQGDAAV